MRDHGDVRLVLEGEIKRRWCAEAIASRANSRHTLLLQRGDHRVHDGLPGLGTVPRKPRVAIPVGDLEVRLGHGIALHEVRHDSLEAVCSETIR